MKDVIVWAADVGSIRKNRFGWCRVGEGVTVSTGTDIREFANGVADDLSQGRTVALGFECPLFVPIPDDPVSLTSARDGEGNRAWCAVAGSGALAVGLTECVWVLESIRRTARTQVRPTLDWQEFTSGEANLFLWEAFVSKGAKAASHTGDAEVAAQTFLAQCPQVAEANAVKAQNPFCLIGAALLRSKLTNDLGVLFGQCVVIRA